MASNPLDLATSIANAVDKVADLLAQILSGAALRKLNYRIEAATHFVHVISGEGEYKAKGFKDLTASATKDQKDLIIHFRKRIFDQ